MAFLECPECSEELHPSTGSNPVGEPVWSESDARTCKECGVISWVSVDSDEGEAYVNTEHETGWKQAVARIDELEAEVERLRAGNVEYHKILCRAADLPETAQPGDVIEKIEALAEDLENLDPNYLRIVGSNARAALSRIGAGKEGE